MFLKLNKVLAFTFSNISIPPMIPFIIYGSLKMGSIFITNDKVKFVNDQSVIHTLKDNLLQYVIGSLFLATVTSFLFGFASYLLLSLYRKKAQ